MGNDNGLGFDSEFQNHCVIVIGQNTAKKKINLMLVDARK